MAWEPSCLLLLLRTWTSAVRDIYVFGKLSMPIVACFAVRCACTQWRCACLRVTREFVIFFRAIIRLTPRRTATGVRHDSWEDSYWTHMEVGGGWCLEGNKSEIWRSRKEAGRVPETSRDLRSPTSDRRRFHMSADVESLTRWRFGLLASVMSVGRQSAFRAARRGLHGPLSRVRLTPEPSDKPRALLSATRGTERHGYSHLSDSLSAIHVVSASERSNAWSLPWRNYRLL